MYDVFKKAEPLLNFFVEKAKAEFGNRIISIFKLGSLGSHGDFSVCSDVDVGLMLDNIQETDFARVQKLWDTIKTADLEYADRLSVFWSSYDNAVFEKGIGRFPPLDRLDFLQYGELIEGVDKRQELIPPTHSELILASAEFISAFMLTEEKQEKLLSHPEKIAQEGARYFTKFVLFPIRLLFTLDKPGIIGSNYDAVEYFKKTKFANKNMIALVENAYKARQLPANQPVKIASETTQCSLVSIYINCIERYAEAVKALWNQMLFEELSKLRTIFSTDSINTLA